MSQEKGGYILVVDDEEEIAELVGRVFEMEKHHVVTCCSAFEAKEVVLQKKAQGLRLCALTCDVAMPERTGLQFIYEDLKGILEQEEWEKLNIALVTATESHEVRSFTKGLVIKKPFEIEDVLRYAKRLQASCPLRRRTHAA